MKKIGLLSDTHSFLDPAIFKYFVACDEIWHAGDIGNPDVVNRLEEFKPLRAVFGNIDEPAIRHRYPLDLRFDIEGLDVWITHIGGYPGRYNKRVLDKMKNNPPGLFIAGHSHILKVMPDKKFDLLYINPGACGHYGLHTIRTIVRFEVESGIVQNLEVVELGRRGR